MSDALTIAGAMVRQAERVGPEIEELEPFESRGYSVHDLTRAFAAVHMQGGHITRAIAQLEALGFKAPTRLTLSHWLERYPLRYAHVGDVFRHEAEQQVVVSFRQSALAAVNAANEAVNLEADRIREGKVKDASAAAQRLMTTGAIATDKVLALTGRPSTIVEHRSGTELLRTLAQLGHADVESDAVDELPDAS